MLEFYSKNKVEKLVRLVGFVIRRLYIRGTAKFTFEINKYNLVPLLRVSAVLTAFT